MDLDANTVSLNPLFHTLGGEGEGRGLGANTSMVRLVGLAAQLPSYGYIVCHANACVGTTSGMSTLAFSYTSATCQKLLRLILRFENIINVHVVILETCSFQCFSYLHSILPFYVVVVVVVDVL